MTNNKVITIIIMIICIILIIFSLIWTILEIYDCLGTKEHNLLEEEKDKEDHTAERGLQKINE